MFSLEFAGGKGASVNLDTLLQITNHTTVDMDVTGEGFLMKTHAAAIGLILAALSLAGCATTEGQQSTDQFVQNELNRRGITPDYQKSNPAPEKVVTPAS